MTNDSHHHRRRHVRHHSDGTVSPVRDAVVRNRGRAAATTPPVNGDALAALAGDDDFDVDDVVFAFEHPEWSSHGFRRADHEVWAATEATPGEASRWRDAGFTADETLSWRTFPHTSRPTLTPEDSAVYRAAGVAPEVARDWTLHHLVPVDDAVKWIGGGIEPDHAAVWRKFGADYDIHKDWEALGVTNVFDARRLSDLGHENITMWMAAGVPLERIPGMHVWEYFRSFGYDTNDLVALDSSGYERNFLVDWAREKIPVRDIPDFIKKGYTVTRAAKLVAKGVTGADAEDLRRGEPVPGKAWTTVKGVITAWAASEGYAVKLGERHYRDGSVEVDVFIREPDSWTDTPIEIYTLRFTHTGRFQHGTDGVVPKQPSIKGFLAIHFPGV